MYYSVVIPAYNARETLADALASVMAQTAAPSEIIVVDDGSTDNSGQIAAGFGPLVKIIKQDNQGCGAATSTGMRAAASDIIATLDADDIWLAEKMERQLAELASGPNISLVFCRQRQFHHGRPDDGRGEERAGLNRSSMVCRRAVFETIGDIIDPPGNRGDLVDWLARAREAEFVFAELPEVLALRRIIRGSLSFGRDPARDRGYLLVAHRAMMRRRLSASEPDAS